MSEMDALCLCLHQVSGGERIARLQSWGTQESTGPSQIHHLMFLLMQKNICKDFVQHFLRFISVPLDITTVVTVKLLFYCIFIISNDGVGLCLDGK